MPKCLNAARGFVSDVVEVDKSPCTTARSAAKVDLGNLGTSSLCADMELQVAMAGWNLTPWQRQLLAGMFAHGKTQGWYIRSRSTRQNVPRNPTFADYILSSLKSPTGPE